MLPKIATNLLYLLKIIGMKELEDIIAKAWEDRSLLSDSETIDAIRRVILLLDEGKLRVAEPTAEGWQVNEWVKKAVVMYFPIQKMKTTHAESQ